MPTFKTMEEQSLQSTNSINGSRVVVLDIAKFIAIFFVMLIHSPCDALETGNAAALFLEKFIAVGAVPLFFILSGYFGAKRLEDKSLTLMTVLKKRIGVLAVPFFFWNGIVLAAVIMIKFVMKIAPAGGGTYFGLQLTWHDCVAAFLGIGRQPIVYQFWFLRDLIVVTIIFVIFHKLFPKYSYLLIVLLLIPIPLGSAMGFVVFGHWMKKIHILIPQIIRTRIGGWGWLWCWSGIGVACVYGKCHIASPVLEFGSALFILILANKLYISNCCGFLFRWSNAVFLIYAIHEPLQTIIGRIWIHFHISFFNSIFSFIGIPLLALCICIFVRKIMDRWTPRLLVFATGGR